jgi:hypothetical protein
VGKELELREEERDRRGKREREREGCGKRLSEFGIGAFMFRFWVVV